MTTEARREQWRQSAAKKRAARTEAERATHNADCLDRHHRKKDDPEYRAKRNAVTKRTHDREKKAEARRVWSLQDDVKARIRETQRERYRRIANNPDFLEKRRRWWETKYRKNREYYLARSRDAKSRRGRAFGCLSASERKAIVDLYKKARQMTEETGVPHEVDHIVPLHGENVSGLHVFRNLQILTRDENRSKGNKTCLLP